MSPAQPFELRSTFLVQEPGFTVVPVAVTSTLYQELNSRFDGFRQRVLIAEYAFDRDWPTWEVHPAGEEVLYLLSGQANLILRSPEGVESSFQLDHPGQALIVPRAHWHTARTSVPTSMLFITPGEGTENLPSPPV